MAKKRTSNWKEQRSLRRAKNGKQDWLAYIDSCRRGLWLKLAPTSFILAMGVYSAIAVWHKWGVETYYVSVVT